MATITNEDGWVTISTDSGSGDTQITATVNEVNDGRNPRTATLVGTTDHGAEAVANIYQASKGEFVRFYPLIYTMANSATTVTLTGESNSQRLTFYLPTLGENQNLQLFLTLPSTYTVTKGTSSQTVQNGQPLGTDWGATGKYNFSITLTINDGGTSTERTEMVYVSSYGGAVASASVTQEGIASTILFDGLTNKTYDVSGKLEGQTQAINIGVTPSGEGWSLEFDED